ncbi:hypothetical protein IFM89_016878 [Coptis chinensis]|uniref:WAT1-related protein n=1 Tax=Coptis chinensis TaxID=261450 RepID=A0A835LYC1_9MAGN|nr:hypothetical protein IFM89_016878 [Coptis chinensis]
MVTTRTCASYVAMVVVQLSYGGSSILAKISLEKGMNQQVFIVYRHLIAMLVLGPLAYAFERMEKVMLHSIKGQAKIIGALVCVGGALIFTFWKGDYLLRDFNQRSLINIHNTKGSLGSRHHENDWIKGSALVLASNAAWSAWFILQAQQDRSGYVILRAEDENLKNEGFKLQAALRSISCPNCGGLAILGEMSFDEQHLRIENVRLKEEILFQSLGLREKEPEPPPMRAKKLVWGRIALEKTSFSLDPMVTQKKRESIFSDSVNHVLLDWPTRLHIACLELLKTLDWQRCWLSMGSRIQCLRSSALLDTFAPGIICTCFTFKATFNGGGIASPTRCGPQTNQRRFKKTENMHGADPLVDTTSSYLLCYKDSHLGSLKYNSNCA